MIIRDFYSSFINLDKLKIELIILDKQIKKIINILKLNIFSLNIVKIISKILKD